MRACVRVGGPAGGRWVGTGVSGAISGCGQHPGWPQVRRRALTEEHARDSFENLLFSVCRFKQLTSRWVFA